MSKILSSITRKVKDALSGASYLSPLGRMSPDCNEFASNIQRSFIDAISA